MAPRLTVDRAELLEGLKQLSKLVKKKGVGKGILSCEDGALIVTLDGVSVRASAEGELPGAVRIAGLSVLNLAKVLPADEPLLIRIESGRLFINSFSLPCELDEAAGGIIQIPMDAPLSILLGLEYTYSDEEIVRSGFWEKTNVARGEKKRLIRWASNKLAVLGVRQEDVEELVDRALRRVNGISTPASK